MDNPSVVVGHLSDEEIKKSIESIVATVDDGARRMAQKFDEQIVAMENSFKRLGNLKVDFGSANGNSSKRNATVIDQQTTAIKRQSQAVKDLTYDQQALAQQKAIGSNANIFSTIDIQIQLTKERLTEAQQQMEAFRQMAAHASTTGDKGFFTFATSNFHQYESQVASLSQQVHNLTQQRAALKEMLSPQGDGFKNYVDSLTKINPELAALNDQYKRGVSLLQTQRGAIDSITSSHEKSTQTEQQRVAELQKAYELELKEREEQAKSYDIQREKTRQLEMENAKTAENLAFQERINAARQAKQGNEGKRVRETNELTGAIAGLLGIQEKEVAVVDAESASQHRLTNYLHQLRSAYQRLDREGMSSSHGKMLADEIQRVSRAVAEMNKQANRPISLSKAMGLDESTLDNIAYKLQQLNAYKMGLKITDPKQLNEMKQVDEAVARLKKDYDGLMGKNSQLMSSNNALARSWNYMKNRLAFYFTVGASTQFVKNLIEVRSQYEMNERALGILIDSAERGTQIFNELSQMALVSPYTLIELSNAARQLTAYDVAAKDVVDTTRRMADISAAVGIPMERLTYALGQIKAYGYLNNRDARMFLNAGIPLVKNLADHYTELEGRMVSVGDVYDRMKKKAIGYNDVMQVITEMTDEGGKFFDFQAKMADTLKVQLANLTLAWNNMLNEIGKSEQWVLVGGIKGLKELFLQWINIEKAALAFGISLGIVKTAQILYLIFGAKINKQLAVQAVLGKKAARAFDGLGASLMKVATNPWTWVTIGVAMLANLALTAYQADEAIKKLNKSIIDAANERVESINKTIAKLNSQYNFEEIAPSEHRLALDTNKDEAKKIWETIREEIEMSSSSAQEFINRLEDIDDINVRVGKGFDYLKDIQKAQAALSQLDIKDIDVEQDMAGWWNLYSLQDGLIENFRDMQKEAGRAEKDWKDYAIRTAQGFHWGGVAGAIIGGVGIKGNEGEHLKRYQKDLQTTVDSIIASMKKYNVEGTNVQREFFATSMDKILQDTDLTEKERLKIRIDAQELFYQSEVKSRQQAIAKETGDYKNALQQELNDFIHFHEQRNGYTLGFEKWLQKTQITMLTETFGKMSAKELKQIDFSKGEWSKWAYEISKKFAEQNNLAIDDVFSNLRKYLSRNFVLYIKTVLQKPDGKSVYNTLTEADIAADEALTKIQRLKTRKGELKAKGASMVGISDIDTEYAKTLQEITEAQEEYNDALAKGGHPKKENTSATKAQKQAETELQKALKDELSLLDKGRSQYKKLTDAGVDSNQALTMVTNQFTNSIQRINNILGKNGLPLFNIKAFAGTDNPNAVLEMLKKQLDAAKVAKNIKPEEIKELEVKYGEIVIDAKVYNTKNITNGLNNELSKIKDEYELALELDADPVLGEVFKEMFNIDPSDFPKTIDEYMQRVQDEFDKGREKFNYQTPLNVFKATESDWIRWGASVGIVTAKLDEQGNIMADDTTALDKFKAKFVEAQGVAKKWAENTVKETENLQHKLADTDGKIAIENEKLQRLILQREKSTNEEERKLLDLKIKDQTETIARLGDEVLQMLPTYKSLFNSIADHSAYVTRKIAEQWKEALENAKNADGTYTITDPKGGTATIGSKEYGKQVDKVNQEFRKTASTMAKIKEAFTKGEDGEVDFAKGLEYVAQEARKAASGIKTIAEIVGFLGGEGAEESVEVLNDIATSMEGVGTAMEGYAKIQSGDVIGGAVDMIKGTWSAVSTWLDNGNKKIDREIKKSENAVKDLELAYKNLERAVEKAYGTAVIGAQKVAIANKEAQLAEVKRQLKLEESRDSKHRDENRIRELRAEIIDLENEIADKTEQIVNDLLGISSVGDAMESLMDGFVEALRSGEDAMKVFDESVDDMIANMVKKMFTTKILTPWFEQQWETIQQEIDKRGKEKAKDIAFLKEKASSYSLTGDRDVFVDEENDELAKRVRDQLIKNGVSFKQRGSRGANRWANEGDVRQAYEDLIREANNSLIQATTPTAEDIEMFAELLRSGQPIIEGSIDEIKELLVRLGLTKDSANKNLSALQQGIQGVTENTAGAIEAYMNSVSQQVYLHSDLLVQIRDAVVAMDSDAQLGVQAQMLLQLQQSYAIQVAIKGILNGWSTPSGLAVRVEMV